MKVMFVVPSNFQYLQALRSERGKNLFLPLAILQPVRLPLPHFLISTPTRLHTPPPRMLGARSISVSS